MSEDLATRLAVLEVKVANMEGIVPQMAKDVQTIKEMIASGKGAWWAIAVMLSVSGLTGALVHKLWP